MTERATARGPRPHTPGAPAPAASLRDRVQSLRLPEGVEADRTSTFSKFLWLMVAVVLIAGGYAGYRYWSQEPMAVAEPKDRAVSTTTAAKPVSESAPVVAPKSKATTTNAGVAASDLKQTVEKPLSTYASQPVAASDDSLTASSGDIALEARGYIIPAHQILVTPQVNGRILKLRVIEGQRMNKGDILAELEDTEFAADHRRATALLAVAQQKLLELQRGNRPEEIAGARAELAEAQSQRAQLLAEWRRLSKLTGTSAVTQSDYEKAEAAYKANEHRIERLTQSLNLMIQGPRVERIELAKAEVLQAEADVVKAKWRLDNCIIRAPVSGTILKKNAEEGNIVNPVAFNGSYSLCDIADLADLEVDLSIQERDISKVFVGQRCRVRAEAYPKRVYEGVVSRMMPIADRAKGAVPVRVKLTVPAAEEGQYLRPEMGAIVAFLGAPPPQN